MSIDYTPESSFGWLDLDSAASEQVNTLMRAMEEPDTVDPIGLGTVRDVISGVLAPGTSTVQTRLRYFFFVPWICQRIESDMVPASQFKDRLRDDEARLIDCLRGSYGAGKGVIGYHAGRKLSRMPSSVYWGGLFSWGIRRFDWSISDYGDHAALLARRSVERDNDGNPVMSIETMWASIPNAPRGFLKEKVSFDLTIEEASFIVDQIRTHHPGSLLAVATEFPAEAAAADCPWNVPQERLSDELQEVLRHARCFSELTTGPQQLYNLLLARRAASDLSWDTTHLEEDTLAGLETWAGMIDDWSEELRVWVDDIDSFWSFLSQRARTSESTRRFIGELLRIVVDDPHSLPSNKRLHALIIDREVRLKGSRARLANRSALANWNQRGFGGRLDYRWGICRNYLDDIARAVSADLSGSL